MITREGVATHFADRLAAYRRLTARAADAHWEQVLSLYVNFYQELLSSVEGALRRSEDTPASPPNMLEHRDA